MQKIYLTKNTSQTKKLGESLARKSLNTDKKRKAQVFGLIGDLGGGKTTFLQGFAKGLGIKEKITSPTFVIMKKYKLPAKSKMQNFYHIDCYRLKSPKEILILGFKQIVSDPRNIIAIEWADKLKKILPKNSTILKFNFINKITREIIIK